MFLAFHARFSKRRSRIEAGWRAGRLREAAHLLACAMLLLATEARPTETPAGVTERLPTVGGAPESERAVSAAVILGSQPREVVDRLLDEKVIVLQEVRREGPLRGAILNSYVIFDSSIDRVYRLLAQSDRQVEFRPELTSIETIERSPSGQIDEQRLKILFRRYVYRLEYRLHPEHRSIEWFLDERFDNDLARVSGYWELFEMNDGRTLGRSGTSIDVGPAVPAVLQDWITRKNLPQTMKRVQRWVNEDGRWRP